MVRGVGRVQIELLLDGRMVYLHRVSGDPAALGEDAEVTLKRKGQRAAMAAGAITLSQSLQVEIRVKRPRSSSRRADAHDAGAHHNCARAMIGPCVPRIQFTARIIAWRKSRSPEGTAAGTNPCWCPGRTSDLAYQLRARK
jgi:hypothetical protein